MKKQLIVFQTDGYGLFFEILTKAYPEEAEKYDGKTIGAATLYVAKIVEGDITGPADQLVITIPYIIGCPKLVWNNEDAFIPM